MRRNLIFAALAFIFISLATTSSRAQTRTPQHYLRERGVKRIRAFDGNTLSVVSRSVSDRYFGRTRSIDLAESMKVDLFDGAFLTVNFDRVEQQSGNSVAWFGKVDGAPLGSATFVRTGNSLIGSVTRGDGKIYQVRTEEDGSQWMVEIDQSAFPAADESAPVSVPAPAPSDSTQADAIDAPDDGSTIDVMVLYTPGARTAAGGATQIQQLVQLGIAETNAGYANSGVIQRVRLVYSGEVNYTESSDFNTDLNRLSNTADGFIDEVSNLRNTYGADLVSLWRSPNNSVCGLAWVLDRTDLAPSALAQYGFSVVAEDCATGYYSFGHEMGHNMGTDHAKDDNAPHGPYPYGSGYKQTTAVTKWRTIMAYDGNCTCPRINYWSNPTVLYNGLPAGIDPNSAQSAANYQVLNNTRTIVANFRAAITGGPPTDATGPALTITSHVNNQTVSASSITITGTASDSGRGDNGISSVTVNGVRATGDTTTGTGTANWSRTLTLSAGANTITVVATDNSAAQNSTALNIVINYSTSTTSTSPTSSTYHVFPQFADGRFGDGTSYRTTLMIANPSSTAGATCTMQMRGFTVPGFAASYSLGPSGWVIAPTSGTQSFVSGYATLSCTANVEAQVLYSYYAPSGLKISEATVFSSPPTYAVALISDERDGGRFAVAIANDSDHSVTYTIFVSSGAFSGSRQISLGARSSTAAFLGELVSGMPANATAAVTIAASTTADAGSVIGLRYTGGVFTTMPASPLVSVSPIASTYHIFPQFADGRFSDGTSYQTSRLYLNPSSSTTANCTTLLRGMTTDNNNQFTLSLPGSSTFVGRTSGTQTFQSGYATLSCSGAPVYAQAVYSYYAPNGVKASEATVFSSPPAASLQILADNREGARVGIAIANDSDQTNTYSITAYNSSGAMVGSTTKSLAARTSIADFVDNWIPAIPAGYYGQVIVSSTTGGAASVIGLRFTGAAFTTIPATIR
jgi:peptidyl-Asp metalloendopeptidase